MHERGLHVDAEDHAEPDQVDAELFGGGPEQRNDDEGELEEIEEEGEHEHEGVDEDQEADLAAGQRGQQMLDPDVAVDAVEGQREHARADQDEDHESRQLGGRFGGLPDQIPAQPALGGAEDERAGAPMAPPSVGVAMPMKIVPSTRKIRNSGGTITKVVCCAIATGNGSR